MSTSGRRDDGVTDPARSQRVLIATVLPSSSGVGVQTHIRQVTSYLRAAGHDVEVVRPGSRFPRLSHVVLGPARLMRRSGIEPLVRLDRALHAWLLKGGLHHHMASRPAVVYAQDPRAAHASLQVRGGPTVPVVMVVHYNESQAQELVERGLIAAGGRTDRSIRGFERTVLPQLDGLVFVSDFMRERVRAAVPESSGVRSVVVPNFLASRERSSRDVARDCITVGSLVDRKNHQYLLHVLAAAAQQRHRPTLTIVGDGPERARLQRLADGLGVADQVWFAGRRPDVDDLLLQHRVYVHSATMENSPFALIEALRAGRPFIAAPVGGVPELAGEAGAGRFWDLRDPAAGSRVLTALLEDPEALAQASRAAEERFDSRFSEEAAGHTLAEFLFTLPR